ncbi:MAG: HIT family protein [Muribaculaceae bacterium]|nr:HIT family protein [Muribaculaceae bacterium]
MASIFSRIIAGEIPCYKVAEDEAHFAFLDINPLSEGHTLVVPKREVDYIFSLTDQEYCALQLFAKRVAAAVEKTVDCRRIATAVIGLEVPHAHIHIVPIKTEGDLDFRKAKLSLPAERMSEIASNIASNFE